MDSDRACPACLGDEPCLRVLVAAGADIDKANSYGDTPVCRAAFNGDVASLRLLIEKGADLSKTDKRGMTAADHAQEKGHKQCAEIIRAAELAVHERAALSAETANKVRASRAPSRSL